MVTASSSSSAIVVSTLRKDRISADVADRFFAPQCSTEPATRFLETAEVEQSCVESARRPTSRLSEIVGTGPDELSEDVFLVAHRLPGIIAHTRFTTVNDALWICLVVDVVAVLRVVVAHHVDGLRILRLVAHHHTCQGTRHRA